MEWGAIVLALIVAFAFAVETTLGFGATVIALSFGSRVLPITELLPAIVPLNMALSAFIAVRHRGEIDRRTLLREVLPLMALGLPLGLWIFTSFEEGRLKRTLGVFVVLLAARELYTLARSRRQPPAPAQQPGLLERLALVVGGTAHGAFGTGGPLAVYALGRRGLEKGAFRATLSSLWLILNFALFGTYWFSGRYSSETLVLMMPLAAGGATGLLLGSWAFRRVPAHVFRSSVYVLLLFVGLGLALG